MLLLCITVLTVSKSLASEEMTGDQLKPLCKEVVEQLDRGENEFRMSGNGCYTLVVDVVQTFVVTQTMYVGFPVTCRRKPISVDQTIRRVSQILEKYERTVFDEPGSFLDVSASFFVFLVVYSNYKCVIDNK